MALDKEIIWANNAESTLAAPIGAGAVACTSQAGDGVKFPSPTGNQCFIITFRDAIGNYERVRCDTRVVDTFSGFTRGIDGTAARAWAAGDKMEVRFGNMDANTRAAQDGRNISAVGGGTGDAITAAFAPTFAALIDKMDIHVTAPGINTLTAPTITVDGIAAPIVKGLNQALVGGDIAGSGYPMSLRYSATWASWVLLNPAKGLTPLTGLMLMWSVPTPPSWAVARDGSALARSTYQNLFAILCPKRNGTTTNGANTLTGLATTTDLYIGMPIEGAGIQAGTTVSKITSATAAEMSQNATASATVPVTLFYYGYGSGGSGTTFGVPDDRGVFERALDTRTSSAKDQSSFTGNTANTSNAITGLATTVGLYFGQAFTGTGIPGGSTITEITSSSAIKISNNATATNTGVTFTVNGRQIGSYMADDVGAHAHHIQLNIGGGAGTAKWQGTGPWLDNQNYTGDSAGGPETKPKSRAYLPIIVY